MFKVDREFGWHKIYHSGIFHLVRIPTAQHFSLCGRNNERAVGESKIYPTWIFGNGINEFQKKKYCRHCIEKLKELIEIEEQVK